MKTHSMQHAGGCTFQHGLTLMEAMLAVAIITILLRLALPVLTIAEQEESTRVLSELVALIEMARSHAIAEHRLVTVCPSADGQVCGGAWHRGVMAFVDTNHNRQRDAGEPLLHHLAWSGLTGSLSWRAFGNRQSLQIDPFGGLRNQNGNFTWCPPAGSTQPAHQLVINSAGRMRLARDINGDGMREDSNGRPLMC